MSNHKLTQSIISVLILITLATSSIQPAMQVAAQSKDGLKRQQNAQTGKVSFIGPESGRVLSASQALGLSPSAARPADPAMALAERYAPEFGITDPQRDLTEIKAKHQDNGRVTVRYQQNYQGIPVMGGELIVNTNENGDLYSMNGEVSQGLSLQTQPTIDSAQARDSALQALAKWYQKTPADFIVSEPELWIFDESLLKPSDRPVELVWRMEVTAKDNALPVRELVLVNAERGSISLHFNQVDTAWNSLIRPNQTGSTHLLSKLSFAPSNVKYEDLVVDTGRNRVYGADKAGDKVDVINITNLSVLSSYSLTDGSAPISLDLSPDGNELAIAQSGTGFVKFVNLTDNSVTETTSVLSGPSTKVTDVIYGRTGILYALTDKGLHVIGLTVSPHAEDVTQYIPDSDYYIERFGAISSDKNTLYYVTGASYSSQSNRLSKYDISAELVKPTLINQIYMYGMEGKSSIRSNLINDSSLLTYGSLYNTSDLTLKAKDYQILSPVTSLPGKGFYATGYNFEGAMADAIYFYDNGTSHKLSVLSTGKTGTLGAIAASPNGSMLFVSSTGGMTKFSIGEVPPGTPVALPPSAHQYNDIAIDTLRGLAYATDISGRIDVIGLDTASVVDSYLLALNADPQGIDLSPDGNELAVALSGLEKILFLNPETGATIAEVTPQLANYSKNAPYDVIYGRSGRLYSSGNLGSGDHIHVIDTTTHTWVARSFYQNPDSELAITQDGNYLYANRTTSTSFFIYDIQTDEVNLLYEQIDTPYASKFTISPDGSKVFTSHGPVWDGTLQSQLGILQGVPGGLIKFIPGRDALVLLGTDNNRYVLKFIDANNFQIISTYYLPYGVFVEMEVSADGSKLVVNMSGGKILVLDLSTKFPPGQTAFGPMRITYTNNNGAGYLKLCENNILSCTLGADPQADAAHKYAGGTWKFYFDKHNRDSLDNNGMPIISIVHYQSGYQNAFWSGTQMVYGDGYGFPLADDVVAHELTHGVTQYESNLLYWYQSGAINESFSDLWGEYYDQTNGKGNDTAAVKWLAGEDITGLGAIRNMKNPPQFGDPDKMISPNYYKGLDDNGGVHTNSGINNKAVFLMVDGGTFNGKTITKLGWDKTAAIYYEANTNLLSSGSDYSDLYYALQQACKNLTGQKDITSANCVQVKKALDAVQMNSQPAANFNPDAPLCPAGQATGPVLTLYQDDFESGSSKWTKTGPAWSVEDGYATSPIHMFYANDDYSSSDSSLNMKSGVSLPAGSKAFLHFKHAFLFDYTLYQGALYYFDGGVLEYSVNNGAWTDAKPLFSAGQNYKGTIFNYPGTSNRLKDRSAFVGDSHGYVSSKYSLSSLAGKTVKFRWRMATDNTVAFFGWFVDDVQIYTCVGKPTQPVLLSPATNALVTDYTPLLDWTNATPAPVHYQVQLADNNTFTAPLYNKADLLTSKFTIPADLAPDTTYYWRARALNPLNIPGAWSTVFSFRTVMSPPVLLTPTDGEAIGTLQPLLDWEDVAGATGYAVQVSDASDFVTTLVNVNSTDSTYQVPTDLPPGVTLYWRVQATGPNGPSAWSTFQFTTPS